MRGRATFAILLLALIGIGLYFLRKRPAPPAPAGNTRVTIAQFGDVFLYAPLYVALDSGYFAEQHIDVSVVTTGGDDKTWAAVIGNSAQFGIADPTFVVASAKRGEPGKVVASIVNGVPFWGVTWRNDIKPIANAVDLRNLRVATFPAPSTAFVLQEKMFNDAGVQPRIEQGAFGSLLTMLRQGNADIALELEPNVSQAVADGAHIVYSMKDFYGDFAITGLTATPAFIQKNPGTVGAVTCGLQKALDLIHKQPERALEILHRRFADIREAVARSALRRATDDGIIPATLSISETAWQKAVNLRISVKDFSGPAPLSTYVDNRFGDEAARTCRVN